jgi:hypothetical protein
MTASVRILSLLCAFSMLPAAQSSPAEPDQSDPGGVAAAFINAHISAEPGYEETIARVSASPLVTERYKLTLTKLYRDALAKDPDYGYGADAVVGGQDAPGRFRVKSTTVDGDRARVVLVGEDPGFPMEVKVDMVREGERWLVDASGDLVAD